MTEEDELVASQEEHGPCLWRAAMIESNQEVRRLRALVASYEQAGPGDDKVSESLESHAHVWQKNVPENGGGWLCAFCLTVTSTKLADVCSGKYWVLARSLRWERMKREQELILDRQWHERNVELLKENAELRAKLEASK